jgi:hypothetical protein
MVTAMEDDKMARAAVPVRRWPLPPSARLLLF